MNQEQRRRFLIEELLRERPSCRRQEIPADTDRQKILLRGLMNVRHPAAIGKRFLEVQDAYLQEELTAKKITRCCRFAWPPRLNHTDSLLKTLINSD